MTLDNERLIKIEVNLFRELNGRHPSLGERQQIINRITFNANESADSQVQSIRSYFYKINSRWPDELEYRHLLIRFSE